MASQDILINWAPQETRVAITENGAVQELHIERTLGASQIQTVSGKPDRCMSGMRRSAILAATGIAA